MKNRKIILNDIYAKSSIEYQLIEYVNNNPLTFVEKPINLISKKLHINTSTLTRTIRKLGYKNYKSFRNFVIEKITEYKNYLIDNSVIKKTSNILNESIISNSLFVGEAFTSIINNTKFNEAINKIITSKRVLLFGIGFSYFICQQMAKYFQLYNINVYNILNFYDALQLVNTSSDDLWIVVSIALIVKETNFLLKELILTEKNQIILITSNSTSEILEKVSYVLKLKTSEAKQNDDVFNFNLKVALVTLMNLIIIEIINKVNNDKLIKHSEINKQTTKVKK